MGKMITLTAEENRQVVLYTQQIVDYLRKFNYEQNSIVRNFHYPSTRAARFRLTADGLLEVIQIFNLNKKA